MKGTDGIQNIDSQELISDPTPRPIELHHPKAIRLELSKVYRDMRLGHIDPSDGTKLAYVLDMLRKSHETAVLQDRIELLEIAANLKVKK
jgi:hypothetical protein